MTDLSAPSNQPATQYAKMSVALQQYAPGLMMSVMLGLAASYISGTFGGPVMLLTLLFGIAFNFLSVHPVIRPGLDVASRQILRLGVALLGARVTLEQVAALGPSVILIVIGSVVLTILVGIWIGRRLGLRLEHALLSSGAVAICGASAALAISSVLPKREDVDRQTILTVVSVTSFSTLAMVTYPPLMHFIGFDHTTAGIFLGGTIHDVAQVVGAGYIISDATGETATIVKLLRVMCLVPVVIMIGFSFRKYHPGGEVMSTKTLSSIFPMFILGFLGLMLFNSFNLIPARAAENCAEISRWCLLIAVAAFGVKTELGELMKIGPRPIIALVLQTLFLAVLVGVSLWLKTS